MKRRLIFRADANATIGRGHLSRCLAIADMLENDFDILFVSHIENKSYIESLSIPYRFKAILSHASFFDFVNQEDIVWLDGYSFDEDFKKHLRSSVFKLIETNDFPYKVENVDLLFNHTPGIKREQFDVVDSKTKLFLGLKYAMIRSAFLDKAKNNLKPSSGRGIFVCFGGADIFDLGLRFVEGLIKNNFDDPIYWVSHKSKEELPELSENVHVISGLTQHEMTEYMSKSKILLIPSSVLSFEAIALRRPFYTGYFVDNQKLIAQGLKKEGLAVGFRNLEINEKFEKSFDELLLFYSDEVKQKELAVKQQKSIDGNSQSRIQKILKNI